LGTNGALGCRGENDFQRLFKIMTKAEIDMVLPDMIMPDMGGGETYDKMKEINPKARVLLSSGYSIDGQATEILLRGCDGFAQKPFNKKRLSQEAGKILDSRRELGSPRPQPVERPSAKHPLSSHVTNEAAGK